MTINRTESLDAWRDAFKLRKRRIPRVEDEVTEYVTADDEPAAQGHRGPGDRTEEGGMD